MKIPTMAVRSLALALALLAVSCAGGMQPRDPDVTPMANLRADAHIGRTMTADSTRISDLADRFTPGETVHAIVDVPGRNSGTLKVKWMFGDETVSEQEMSLGSGRPLHFEFRPAESGSRTGEYRLEVEIDGNRVETERFQVVPS